VIVADLRTLALRGRGRDTRHHHSRQVARATLGWPPPGHETGPTDYLGRTLAVPAARRDGSRISVEFTVTLLRDLTGPIQGVGAILRDVSAKWEEQRSLHRRIGELERELAALRVAPGK
jgi:hypothetical protein